MELQIMMDSSTDALNGTAGSIWLGPSSPPAATLPYHNRLSPNRQEDSRVIVGSQSVGIGYHEANSSHVLWQDKRDNKHGASVDGGDASAGGGTVGVTVNGNREPATLTVKHSLTSCFNNQPSTNGLKRRLVAELATTTNHQHTPGESERKQPRRDGSVGSNGSGQGWTSTQVDEFAERLAADFDGSLSALTASDLANAVASYNMSEALLGLPSLTVFKQEAPSPEHLAHNSSVGHAQQQSSNASCVGGLGSVETDSNNNTTHSHEIATTTEITTSNTAASPCSTTGINNNGNHNHQHHHHHHHHHIQNHGQSNNQQNIVNGRETATTTKSTTATLPTTTNLQQLLYANGDEYPTNSSTTSLPANHVSSSSASLSPSSSSISSSSPSSRSPSSLSHPAAQQANEFNEDSRFQYVLAAATSIATKINEETLTYLNQGQSYEIKLKKLGDLSAYRGKILKSSIRICFHERRLQYAEREQMLTWQRARPGERLLEIDVPLSYGIVEVAQNANAKNSVGFMWDPTKEVGVYIKVNCISTEFTPKKHGGEKGVPFRIIVETRLPGGPRLHVASCQVKVFKLKGADRKHKQDREKILRRPPHEQDKYQPSYDCTVLSDMPLDSLSSASSIGTTETPISYVASSDSTITSEARVTEIEKKSSPLPSSSSSSSCCPSSPPPMATCIMSVLDSAKVESLDEEVRVTETVERRGVVGTGDDLMAIVVDTTSVKASSVLPGVATSTKIGKTKKSSSLIDEVPGYSIIGKNTMMNDRGRIANGDNDIVDGIVVSDNSVDTVIGNSARDVTEVEKSLETRSWERRHLSADANVTQTNAWLRARRFGFLQSTFASFSAEDILRLSRDDLIQICGLADGIRMYNALHSQAPRPKLTLYFAIEGAAANSPWRAIYLENFNSTLLATKLVACLDLPTEKLHSVLILGPQGVHVLVSNELVANIKDESMYLVETIRVSDSSNERYKLLLKPSSLVR